MKKHNIALRGLAIASLLTSPAITFAAVPAGLAGTPYDTDAANSYVQDQTSQVMGSLNNILCFMGAMAPDQMVNAGAYIALVDKNTCDSKGSGGQSGNTGPAYVPVVVNSTRASNADPMIAKAWLAFHEQGMIKKIKVYASATQAPSTTLPYGVFRMDYCGNTGTNTNCAEDKGYINASSSGLSFFSAYNSGSDSETTQLLLNASSNAAGSGTINESYSWNGGGTSTFTFAYNTGYFVRNDGTVAGDICFDRNPANADESVWRYGLYNSTTGARITRNSGFPIEYTDTSVTPNVTLNGYAGYYGLWTPGAGPASGDTVQKITYSNNGATKTPYTLLKTGGKLTKYTTANKTLAALNKVTFWYYAQNNIGSGTVIAAGSQYELYWDDTNKNFVVSGKQNPSTGNMEPITPTAIANNEMVTANQWGLFGWSQMLGGQFGIKGSDFATLATNLSSTTVVTQIQDVVYPSQFAALGNLVCINDCPTKALIDASNGGSGTAYSNAGWSQIGSGSFVTYVLNSTSGNLNDVFADVISTYTTGTNSNGVRSGRLITTADKATMITNKENSGICGTPAVGVCNAAGFNQGDIDFLPVGSSYYIWETGGQPWNQIAILKDQSSGAPVVFDAPLQVSFIVPAGVKYGSYAGATISLQYGSFGDLWGIPNECIDVTTNTACVFSGGSATPQNNQRWTSKFSIPFNTTDGYVTSGATTYYVKALDKEIRLSKVACAGTGLTAPTFNALGLPDATTWSDPTPKIGTIPVVTDAPKVIHGVKQ